MQISLDPLLQLRMMLLGLKYYRAFEMQWSLQEGSRLNGLRWCLELLLSNLRMVKSGIDTEAVEMLKGIKLQMW